MGRTRTFHIRPPIHSSFISKKHILDDWTNPSILPFSIPTSPCTQGCLWSVEAFPNCHRVKARWTSQIGQSFCLDQSALPTWMKAENCFSSQLWRKAPPTPLCFSFLEMLFCSVAGCEQRAKHGDFQVLKFLRSFDKDMLLIN